MSDQKSDETPKSDNLGDYRDALADKILVGITKLQDFTSDPEKMQKDIEDLYHKAICKGTELASTLNDQEKFNHQIADKKQQGKLKIMELLQIDKAPDECSWEELIKAAEKKFPEKLSAMIAKIRDEL